MAESGWESAVLSDDGIEDVGEHDVGVLVAGVDAEVLVVKLNGAGDGLRRKKILGLGTFSTMSYSKLVVHPHKLVRLNFPRNPKKLSNCNHASNPPLPHWMVYSVLPSENVAWISCGGEFEFSNLCVFSFKPLCTDVLQVGLLVD